MTKPFGTLLSPEELAALKALGPSRLHELTPLEIERIIGAYETAVELLTAERDRCARSAEQVHASCGHECACAEIVDAIRSGATP